MKSSTLWLSLVIGDKSINNSDWLFQLAKLFLQFCIYEIQLFFTISKTKTFVRCQLFHKVQYIFHWIQIFEQKYYANEESSSDPPDLHVNGHVGWFVFIAHDLFKRTERGQAPSLKPFSVANSNTQISKKLNSRQNLLKSRFFPYWW